MADRTSLREAIEAEACCFCSPRIAEELRAAFDRVSAFVVAGQVNEAIEECDEAGDTVMAPFRKQRKISCFVEQDPF